MAQVPPCSGIRSSISYLFWGIPLPSCVGFLELSWEILSPETWFSGFTLGWHSIEVLNRYLRFPGAHGYIECPLLFSSMAWLMSSDSRSHILVPWLLDSLLMSQAMEKDRRGHSIHLWAPGRSQIPIQKYKWVPFWWTSPKLSFWG